MQVHWSTERTPFDLAWARHPPNIGIAVESSRISEATSNESPIPVQLKRATMQRPTYILKMATEKWSAAEEKKLKYFDGKVRFRPVVAASDRLSVDRPPWNLRPFERTEGDLRTGTVVEETLSEA